MQAAKSEVAHALTWTLTHSIWVGISAAIFLCALLCLLPSRRARWRYAASIGALLCVPIAAVWALARELEGNSGELQLLLDSSRGESSALSSSFDALLSWADARCASLAQRLEPFEPWIACAWIVAATLAFLRVAGGLVLLERGSLHRSRRAGPRCQARLARLARRIGHRRRVHLYWSERAEVPMVIGTLRPRVVIPARLEAAAESGELDLVLLHELAHVRRGDSLARAAEALIQAIFLFNPAISWIASRAAREREHCCDDIALEAGGDRLGYVRALASLETARCARIGGLVNDWKARIASAPVLRWSDGTLVERVRRLAHRAPPSARPKLAAAFGGLCLGSAGLAAGALPTHAGGVPASFEVELSATLAPAEPETPSDTRIEKRVAAHLMVLARHGEDSEGEPAGLWISKDLELLAVQVIDDEADTVPARFVRIKAFKSSK